MASIIDKMLGGMNFAEFEKQISAFFRHAEAMTVQVNALRHEQAQMQRDLQQLRGQVQSVQSALLRIEQCLTISSSNSLPSLPQNPPH